MYIRIIMDQYTCKRVGYISTVHVHVVKCTISTATHTCTVHVLKSVCTCMQYSISAKVVKWKRRSFLSGAIRAGEGACNWYINCIDIEIQTWQTFTTFSNKYGIDRDFYVVLGHTVSYSWPYILVSHMHKRIHGQWFTCMADSDKCSISVASTSKCKLSIIWREWQQYTHYFFHCYSALPNAGKHCKSSLVSILAWTVSYSSLKLCNSVPSPSVWDSLLSEPFSSLVAFLDSCLDSIVFSVHMVVLGMKPKWTTMYDLILRKSLGQCHIWYVTKCSKCRPCLNFDVYTVDIPVACSLASPANR